MHMHGLQTGGRSKVFRQDKSNVLVAIDFLHHKIHEGNAFAYYNYDSDIDISAPKYFRLVTGANYEIHFTFGVTLNTAGTISLIEAPTTTGNGDDRSASIYNLNRKSSTAAELAIWEDPTVTVETGVIGLWRIGTAGGFTNSSVGGPGSNRQEYILKASTVYAFKILTTADNNQSWLGFSWYEV